jgi:carbamoyl-phosphate synthase large subunit
MQMLSHSKHKKITCLFTGGGGAGNESINRILGKKYNLHFTDANIDNFHPSIPPTNRHLIPKANDANFTTRLRELTEELNVDILIPGVDEELALCRYGFEDSKLHLMLPDAEFINVMTDKYQSMNALSKVAIKTPKTLILSDFILNKPFNYPIIVKPINGRGSRDVCKINNIEQLRAMMILNDLNCSNFVAQELLVGTEYTVSVVADMNGNLMSIVPIKVLEKKGITISAQVIENKSIYECCEKIHEYFKPSGTYNVQLIVDKYGDAQPFEINPRVSTTFCLVLECGIDAIAAFLGYNDFGSIKAGLKLHRHWHNSFSQPVS